MNQEQKKLLSKYRSSILIELILLSGWLIYFVSFVFNYQEAIFYVDKNAPYIVQLVFLMTYFLDGILIAIFVSFLLVTLHIFLIVFLLLKRSRRTKSDAVILTFTIGSFLFFSICLVLNLLWPVFVLVLIFSMTSVYITYVLSKQFYGKELFTTEPEGIVESAGPFVSEEEVHTYFISFCRYWEPYYNEQGFELFQVVRKESSEKYYLDITISRFEADEETMTS